jgi:class 3 adenylate cyclase
MTSKEQPSSEREVAAVLCVRPTPADGALDGLREAVVDGVARRKGRLVADADGRLLVVVRNAYVATMCAVEVQQDLAARNAALGEDQRIVAAMGVDVGEVDASADGVAGWTVDIASQLAAMAAPEEVLLSQFAHGQAIGRSKQQYEDAGTVTITEEADPITVHRLIYESRPYGFVPRVSGGAFKRRLWTAILITVGIGVLYVSAYLQGN